MSMHHRNLYEASNQPPNIDLVGRPYMLDFFAAALTVCIHLLRSDAPLDTTLAPEGTIPARQTILSTLTNCLDIFSKEQNKSLCFRTGHRLLMAVFALIPKEQRDRIMHQTDVDFGTIARIPVDETALIR
ncbi:uncharacterized protein K460DRAFT_414714 [Cucurbitaria berberidis CBS 394.84]|uniref:Uncharacterized protein n=1 Tax=Cucurbitaria berberidis CBS 394.84 TaxID=1168544 RepID=A0A9P4GMD1_9PLEO|nr:uncharacterized protein K460DRAFT_414714 [Cucurbitaria berberidis CBS 394.84]KAF1848099.1 hypothetical protein K460DRAFT_414714 [Cucurbitaria berberidis CBS 394.84]